MRVLLVEDDPQQAALVRALLTKRSESAGADGADVALDHTDGLEAACRQAAAVQYNVILLDLNLPDCEGLETLRRMRREASDTPIVILSGEGDTAVAIQALQEGAQDYLLKGAWPRDLLVRSIRYAIERHRSEQRLRERELERDRLLRALSERVRELGALHETSKLLQMKELWDAQLLQRLVPIIARGWQYPEITEVRVVAGAISASSAGFRETAWMQTATFVLVDGSSGRIDVAYVEERPAADEGPFLNEERQALAAIAEMLRNCLNGRIAQRQLQAREAEYRTSFETAPVGKAHAECGTWRITRVNPRLCQITGYSADELLAMTVMDLTHPDDRERTRRLQLSLESGELPTMDYEKRYLRKDGRTIWAHVTAAPILLPGGAQPLQYVAVIEDVTEHKAAVEALARSERLLNSVIDTMPVGIWITDESGRIVRGNPAGERIWGGQRHVGIDGFGEYNASWLESGKPIEPHEWGLARAIERGETSLDELMEIECFDGTRKVVRNCAMPIRDAAGQIVAAIATNEDVTAKLRAEAALAESERFARSVVDSLTSHIAILDDRARVIAVNRAWREFAASNGGAGTDDAACGIGADYLAVCDEAARHGVPGASEVSAGIRQVLNGEAPEFRLEYECSDPTQQQEQEQHRWFEMTVTCFAGDGPRRLVVKHQNVTARKHNETLERERSALHDAVRAMDQVLSVVGHELRTPLAGLRLLSEFLLTDGAASSEQSAAFLKSIHAEVIRMGEAVNNLLEAARLDSGRAKWNWGEYCPEAVVRQAVESVGALADAASNRLELESHLGGVPARGDGEAVRRLVLNLLSNSIKHTNGGQVRVVLRREREDASAGGEEWLAIQVVDTGGGIPPHIMERLGEAFTLNAGVVGARHIGGTGLGLSICRGIIEAHGGTLDVQSVVGQGTTVTARLRPSLAEPRALRKTDRGNIIRRKVAA